MIYITETSWDRVSMVGTDEIKACTFAMGTFEPFGPRISITETNKEIGVDQTIEIAVDTNSEYEIINSDDTVVEVTKAADKMTVKGLKAGNATITAKVNETVYDSINIEVKEDYTVRYYFVNNYKWTDLKVYMWNSSTQKTNGEYPGVAIGKRAFVDMNGNDVYAISFQRYADNYEGFIVSGVDGPRPDRCKTEDILLSNFGDNNGVELDGWQGEGNTALVKFGFFVYELYLNIAVSVEFGEGTEIPLNAKTNGENVTYEITSGADKIELKNTADTGVTIMGKAAGTATFTASVSDGSQTVTKTVNVTVLPDETLTYYFINEYEWGYVDAYLYTSDQHNNGWPGVPMTLLGRDENGKEVYSVQFKKYSDGWIGMVITGSDNLNGTYAKTSDIIFSELNGNDCIRVTGWADMNNFVASYETKVMGDYLLLSDYSLTMNKNTSKTLTYVSNKDVSVINSDPTVVQINELADGVEINSLNAGTSTITFTIGEGENTISKTCEVTVNPDDPDYVTYYFANNYAWSDLKVYLWDDAGQSNASFPGVPLNDNNYILNSEGNYTYEITFDKNEHNWTHCIISGFDSGKNSLCKTENINFGDLNLSGKNMILINETEWNNIDTPDGVNYYKCSYQTGVFTSFVPDVSISETAKSINVNEMIELSITSNTDYEVVNGNGGIIRAIRNGDKLLVKGLKAGSSTIEVYVDRGGPQEKKVTCVVTVENATTPLYSVKGNFPDWYFNDNPKFYVWAWGREVEGSGMWIKCYVIDDEIQFSTNINFEHCKLVRFKPETTTPELGSNVWNESGELTFNSQNIAVYPD